VLLPFGPWRPRPGGGFHPNHAQIIASQVKDKLKRPDVELHVVPVVWGKPGEVVGKVIDDAKKDGKNIDMILSIGEGPSNSIVVEKVGGNKRDPIPDINNKIPGVDVSVVNDDSVTDPKYKPPKHELEKSVHLTDPTQLIDEIKDELANHRRPAFPVGPGTEAGNYLCDEMCYDLGTAIGKDDSIVRDGHFIHIPPLRPDGTVPDPQVDESGKSQII